MVATLRACTRFLVLILVLLGCESPSPEPRLPPTADELGRLQLTYERRLRATPGDLETRVLLGHVLLDLGQIDQSMDQFQMVLGSDSLHVGAMMGLSEVLTRILDHETALSLAKRAVAVGRDAETLERLSIAWLGIGKLENAGSALVEAIEMDPARPSLHELLSGVQMARGDVAAAQASLERAVELDPASHQTNFALGSLLCERLGRCAESLDLLQRAIALAPDSASYKVAAGRALLQEGRIREALQEFSTAAERDPSAVEAHIGLGVSRARLEMHVEAATALERALELDPVHPAVRLQLASVYRHLGRNRDAEKQHAAHRQIEPHVTEIEQLRVLAQPGRNPGAHFDLARLYARLGHDEGTVRYLRNGLALQPENARAWQNLGNAHVRLGRSGEAISAYRQALNLNPNYALAWYNLGTAYATGGYIDLGRQAYQRALELSGESVDILVAMGNLELQQGNAPAAIERYRQALSRNPDLPSAQRGLVLAYRLAGDSTAAARAMARFSGERSPASGTSAAK
jgi:tetratricopeptide (TPR) repeat protein